MIRRGAVYGPPLPEGVLEDDGADRGLMFAFIGAHLGRQFDFVQSRKLASWAGLTPTVRGSDRTVRYGHISKQGDPWLRWIMCEATHTTKRHPAYAATYARLAQRRGKKTAITAIARRLLTHAYHLLREAEATQTAKEAYTPT